jgi:hypothetical protein
MAIQKITSGIIADGAILAADIADGSITTAKIADGNVTSAKIDTVANTQITGLVTASQIATVANTQITGSIEATQVGTTVSQLFGMRNRIINGAMEIDQRNAGASVATTTTGNSVYTLDRWAYYTDQASKFTIQKTPSATETGFSGRLNAGFTDYLACTSTSNYSVISTDTLGVFQIIEACNIADLAWGTANAKTITLSFWAYSSIIGTHAGSIRNANGYNLSYVFTYSIPVANTWTKINLTIAGPTSGTWLTTGQGATIYFNAGAGSNSQTTAGLWTVGNYTSTSGAINVVGTNGATFYITGVQLEVGSTATPFERRLYNQELANCKRYYQAYGNFEGTGIGQNTGAAIFYYSLSPTMRAAPTTTFTCPAVDRIGVALTSTTAAGTVFSADDTVVTFATVTMSGMGQPCSPASGALVTASAEL